MEGANARPGMALRLDAQIREMRELLPEVPIEEDMRRLRTDLDAVDFPGPCAGVGDSRIAHAKPDRDLAACAPDEERLIRHQHLQGSDGGTVGVHVILEHWILGILEVPEVERAVAGADGH